MPGKAHLHGASGDGERPLGALPLPTGPLGAAVVSGLVLHPLRPPPPPPPNLLESWEHEREVRGKTRTGLEGALVRRFGGLVETAGILLPTWPWGTC